MGELVVDARKACTACWDAAKAAGKDPPRIIVDHTMGDMICTGCGVVLQDHCIDESEEWRNFAAEGVSEGPRNNTRCRAEHGKLGDFDTSNEIATHIGGASHVSLALQKAQQSAESRARSSQSAQAQQEAQQDKKLKQLVARIRELAGRLSLGEPIIRRCHALLQDLADKGKLTPTMQTSKLNALIHLACSQERAPRTIAELAEANAKAAEKRLGDEKKIEKRVKELARDLEIGLPTRFVEDEDLMARFVNLLELTREICKPAMHIARQADKLGVVRAKAQGPVVACAILIVAWLLDVPKKPLFTEVANVAKVPEAQVRAAYRGMLPRIRQGLLPQDFLCRLPAGVDGLPPPR